MFTNFIKEVSSDIIYENNKIDVNRIAYYVMEEAGELTKELTKFLRGDGCEDRLEKEVADMYYTLSMIVQQRGYSYDSINKIIKETEDRARKAMKIGPYKEGVK